MPDYQDERFEWDEAKSQDRMARSGFDFHAAVSIFNSDRYVERFDEAHSEIEKRHIATGQLGAQYVSVVYTWRGNRRRILSAFKADDNDITDYLVTYAVF